MERLTNHVDPFIGCEQRMILVGIMRHRDDYLVEQLHAAPHHIDVAVMNRIESPWIDRQHRLGILALACHLIIIRLLSRRPREVAGNRRFDDRR